ncbi:MAG: TRAP transporter small permease [Oligoflexia bacterium]|nr:TRAP transporter small permease [Oligoflexia bacterium]
MLKFFTYIDTLVYKFSLYALIVAIFTMLSLTIYAIVMRLFSITSLWIDPLVRHLVFLSAFLGGSLAIGRRQLIAIDIVAKYLESTNRLKIKLFFERIIYITCIFTLTWLIFGSFKFIRETFQYEGIDFLGIHKGFLVSIIPFGFSLMVYRFFYLFISSFKK